MLIFLPPGFRFEAEMVEKLRQYAAQENRTLSKMAETILWLYWSNRETEEKK